MPFLSTPVLAEAAKTSFEPLFGSQPLALLVILGGIAVFMFAVAAVGRWLAATHPEEPPPVEIPAPSLDVFAAIAAAVAVTFDGKAQIKSVQPAATPVNVDPSHLQWGAEGRRNIYSSHKLR